MVPSRVELLANPASRAQLWKGHLRLLKEGCLGRSPEIRRRLIRPALYKLFQPYFKKRYLHEAKRKASIIDWNSIYCGETKGLVSIVLPVYNQAHLLEESVESVLCQQYNNFELIIVNDGSTDGVEGILDRFADNPRILILSQENRKLPAALNSGFAHARGEFLTWTSADNIMLPAQITEQVRFLRENDFIQMVYSNHELIDEQGKAFEYPGLTIPGTNIVNTDKDVRSLNYTYNFINACFLYRSYVARIIGNYDPKMYGAEDYDYWMRVSNHFAIQHIGHKKSYYKYRLHSNTILGREGGLTIDEAIIKAQQLDLQRQSFFRLPMTFYIPRAALPDRGKDGYLSRQLKLQLIQFETCEILDMILSKTGINEKRAVFLTKEQMKQREYPSVVHRCKHDKLLVSFGMVDRDIAEDEIDDLNLLDWIIMDTRQVYHRLHGTLKNKLLCVSPWDNYLRMYSIIANHHLFYKNLGEGSIYETGRHRIYWNERSSSK